MHYKNSEITEKHGKLTYDKIKISKFAAAERVVLGRDWRDVTGGGRSTAIATATRLKQRKVFDFPAIKRSRSGISDIR